MFSFLVSRPLSSLSLPRLMIYLDNIVTIVCCLQVAGPVQPRDAPQRGEDLVDAGHWPGPCCGVAAEQRTRDFSHPLVIQEQTTRPLHQVWQWGWTLLDLQVSLPPPVLGLKNVNSLILPGEATATALLSPTMSIPPWWSWCFTTPTTVWRNTMKNSRQLSSSRWEGALRTRILCTSLTTECEMWLMTTD